MEETKKTVCHNDGKRKLWKRKETIHDPKHTTLSVKHDGGNVTGCGCTAARGTGAPLFIDDVTVDRSSRKKCEVYILFRFSNASKLIRWYITVQMKFVEIKKIRTLQWPSQSKNPSNKYSHYM